MRGVKLLAQQEEIQEEGGYGRVDTTFSKWGAELPHRKFDYRACHHIFLSFEILGAEDPVQLRNM